MFDVKEKHAEEMKRRAELEAAARLLKKNCEEHIDNDLCEGCPFAVAGEPCPLDTGTPPEGWKV